MRPSFFQNYDTKPTSFCYNKRMTEISKKYTRVILKLSGEALLDNASHLIFSKDKLDNIVTLLKTLNRNGVKVGVIVGAGNIFRGRIASEVGLKEEDGDYLGMVGTVINCKCIADLLAKNDVPNELFSALAIEKVAKGYNVSEARKAYDEGKVVLFAGGIGEVKHTTDTAASTRALEMNAELILAAKNGVDGVYDKDPNKYPDAKFLQKLTYKEVLDSNLKVMDKEAAELLLNKDIVTRVFSMDNFDNFYKVISGDDSVGSIISK